MLTNEFSLRKHFGEKKPCDQVFKAYVLTGNEAQSHEQINAIRMRPVCFPNWKGQDLLKYILKGL